MTIYLCRVVVYLRLENKQFRERRHLSEALAEHLLEPCFDDVVKSTCHVITTLRAGV